MILSKSELQNAVNALLCLNDMQCEFKTYSRDETQAMSDSRISQSPHGVVPDDEFAVITCKNSCRYYINVEGNSQLTTVAAIFDFVSLR